MTCFSFSMKRRGETPKLRFESFRMTKPRNKLFQLCLNSGTPLLSEEKRWEIIPGEGKGGLKLQFPQKETLEFVSTALFGLFIRFGFLHYSPVSAEESKRRTKRNPSQHKRKTETDSLTSSSDKGSCWWGGGRRQTTIMTATNLSFPLPHLLLLFFALSRSLITLSLPLSPLSLSLSLSLSGHRTLDYLPTCFSPIFLDSRTSVITFPHHFHFAATAH